MTTRVYVGASRPGPGRKPVAAIPSVVSGMKYCFKCGIQTKKTAAFCHSCGAVQPPPKPQGQQQSGIVSPVASTKPVVVVPHGTTTPDYAYSFTASSSSGPTMSHALRPQPGTYAAMAIDADTMYPSPPQFYSSQPYHHLAQREPPASSSYPRSASFASSTSSTNSIYNVTADNSEPSRAASCPAVDFYPSSYGSFHAQVAPTVTATAMPCETQTQTLEPIVMAAAVEPLPASSLPAQSTMENDIPSSRGARRLVLQPCNQSSQVVSTTRRQTEVSSQQRASNLRQSFTNGPEVDSPLEPSASMMGRLSDAPRTSESQSEIHDRCLHCSTPFPNRRVKFCGSCGRSKSEPAAPARTVPHRANSLTQNSGGALDEVCFSCQRRVNSGAPFCMSCGVMLKKECQTCRRLMKSGDVFCQYCGNQFTG